MSSGLALLEIEGSKCTNIQKNGSMLFIQNYDTYIVGGQISSSNLFLGLKLQKWHGWGGR